MKKSQSGFSTVEGLLLLVIVAILAFTGWFVYRANNNANDNLNLAAGTNVAAPSSGCSYSLSLGTQTGAAGTFNQDLIFTNNSKKSCTLKGYPKVTLTDANGKLIGKAAANDTSATAANVTVAAGKTVHATLSLPDPGIATGCDATQSTYISATLPGSSTDLKVTGAQQYCPGFLVAPLQSGD